MMMVVVVVVVVVVVTTVTSFNPSVHLWFIARVYKFMVHCKGVQIPGAPGRLGMVR